MQRGFDIVQKWRPQLRTLETETINMAKKHKKAAKRDTPSSRRANDAVERVHEDAPGDKLSSKQYLKELAKLQIDLIKMQDWIVQKKLKVLVIFEGRDAAGKGGAIKRITESLNPRVCRVVALSKPTDREQTQWYFQRYVPHLPAAGEMVILRYDPGG